MAFDDGRVGGLQGGCKKVELVEKEKNEARRKGGGKRERKNQAKLLGTFRNMHLNPREKPSPLIFK